MLAAATLASPMTGCRMFAWPAAHTTAEHEAYYHRKVAEVDACTAPDCNVEQAALYGPGPVVRTALPGEEGLSPADRLAAGETWYVSLPTAVRIALSNNKVIRQDAQFNSPSNPLLANLDFADSIFDPAIQDTNILFGNRGVAAAMSDFSPQLTGSYAYGRNDSVVNVGAPVDASDTTRNLTARLEKQLHFGGTLGIQHDLDFTNSNSPVVGLDSSYTGTLQADFTMPLWAASGTEFTQIAGPAAFISPRVTSVNQGVLIARISSEVARVDLEESVRNAVLGVVNRYWTLALAYERVKTERKAVEGAQKILDKTRAGFDAGRTTAAEEAQAAQTFYAAEVRLEQAFRALDEAERILRRDLGLPVYDGRLIRPADDPRLIALPRMWNPLLSDALARRPQLRRLKHNLRSTQLQLRAARSLNRPRLDFISQYRANGFGPDDFGDGSVYESLTDGDLTGWTLGAQFSMPLDFKLQRSLVDNLELRISKSVVQLAEAEEEIAHELALAYQNAQRQIRIVETNGEQLDAAVRLVKSLEAAFDASRGDLDQLVRAQATQAQAEIAYFESLTQFEQQIAELDFRRAALLEQVGVQLHFPDLPVAEDCDPRPRPLHALVEHALPGAALPPRLPSHAVTADPRLGPLAEPVPAYDRSAALPTPDAEDLGEARKPSGTSPYDGGGSGPAEGEGLAPAPLEADEPADAPAGDRGDAPAPLREPYNPPADDGRVPDLFEDTAPGRRDQAPMPDVDPLPNDPLPNDPRLDDLVPDEPLPPEPDAGENPFELTSAPAGGASGWVPASRPMRTPVRRVSRPAGPRPTPSPEARR